MIAAVEIDVKENCSRKAVQVEKRPEESKGLVMICIFLFYKENAVNFTLRTF